MMPSFSCVVFNTLYVSHSLARGPYSLATVSVAMQQVSFRLYSRFPAVGTCLSSEEEPPHHHHHHPRIVLLLTRGGETLIVVVVVARHHHRSSPLSSLSSSLSSSRVIIIIIVFVSSSSRHHRLRRLGDLIPRSRPSTFVTLAESQLVHAPVVAHCFEWGVGLSGNARRHERRVCVCVCV